MDNHQWSEEMPSGKDLGSCQEVHSVTIPEDKMFVGNTKNNYFSPGQPVSHYYHTITERV